MEFHLDIDALRRSEERCALEKSMRNAIAPGRAITLTTAELLTKGVVVALSPAGAPMRKGIPAPRPAPQPYRPSVPARPRLEKAATSPRPRGTYVAKVVTSTGLGAQFKRALRTL